MKNMFRIITLVLCAFFISNNLFSQFLKDIKYDGKHRKDKQMFAPYNWSDTIPMSCPFKKSETYKGLAFLGVYSYYPGYGDTFYPSWASDDKMYSPYTDGECLRLDGSWEPSWSMGGSPTTGNAVMEGNDPLNLKIYSTERQVGHASPYGGRYPAGSLVYNGIWYYGTYCLDSGNGQFNWPILGPFVGFRISKDYGKTWTDTPHTPSEPLFGEKRNEGMPVRIGSPHFVDFGKNMEYSPDGYAYMVAHGADNSEKEPRYLNASWITGDQVYLIRVKPSPETINDRQSYEYYGGKDSNGSPIWTNDYNKIKPLLEWDDNMGCVTITYNAPLKRYIMCVTDGGNTVTQMNTYILESESLTGEWKIINYMKSFGEQAYFVNFPSKFISKDGKTMWICYSGNFCREYNGIAVKDDPIGSIYGVVFHKVRLLRPTEVAKYPNHRKL